MNRSDSKFPEISHFLTNITALSAVMEVMQMPRHAKAWKFKPVAYQKTQDPFWTKICMNISFQLLLYIMKVKSQEDE